MTKHNPLNFLTLSMLMIWLLSGCMPATPPASSAPTPADISRPAATLAADQLLPTDTPHTVAEAEELAGFDVKEPTYLPNAVSFDFAAYQPSPHPKVTLYYQYADRGTFF